MGLSASQGRLLLLTERKNDLEFRAQQISQQRLVLSQQLDSISRDYENATSNRQMMISVQSNDGLTYTKNLTYSLLISGTLSTGNLGGKTGIQSTDKTKNDDFAASSSFRLINADGAIVVGDESEIPTEVKDVDETPEVFEPTTDDTADADKVEDGPYDGEYVNIADLYADKDAHIESSKGVKVKNMDDEDDAYEDAIEVTYKDKQGNSHTVYYNPDTGEIMDGLDNPPKTKELDEGDNISVSKTKDGVKVIHTKYTSTTLSSDLEPDANGVYTVGDKRYVIDPLLLKDGGSSTGPNYLQDCLRNGKYLIQKGTQDVDEHEFLWKDVSWDAVGTISDRYYTDDDDAAKAKYDRKQSEIQNQDKKLELELNNIETQRSAVTTEIESVQKVLDDNIQSSFKTFNA